MKKFVLATAGLLMAVGVVLMACSTGFSGSAAPSSPTTPSANAPKNLSGLGAVAKGADSNKYLVRAVDDVGSGTGTGTVGTDAFANTNRYRIPVSTVIPSSSPKHPGRIIVIGDARFGNRGDLPHKASTWARTSDDNGENWNNIQTVSHFDDVDMSNARNGQVYQSVSTGDAAIGSDSKGNVYAISTFVPPMIGNFFGGKSSASGSPYAYINNKCYLLLKKNTTGAWQAGVQGTPQADQIIDGNGSTYTKLVAESGGTSSFEYAVPVTGGKIVKFNYYQESVDESVGPTYNGKSLYMDEYYFLYTDQNMTEQNALKGPKLVATTSNGGQGTWDTGDANYTLRRDNSVHMHVFMGTSPLIVWRGGTFIGLTQSTNGGETWGKTRDITYMVNPDYSKNFANAPLQNYQTRVYICPTGGFETRYGANAGKVVFAIYRASQSGSEQATSIWSADQGKTWTAGNFVGGGGSNNLSNPHKGESVIVEAPNGDWLMISRNARSGTASTYNPNFPTYAVSTDFGANWTNKGYVAASGEYSGTSNSRPLYSVGNLISASNLYQSKSDVPGLGDHSLVAISIDSGADSGAGDGNRKGGKVFVAAIVRDGGNSWKFKFNFTGNDIVANLTEASDCFHYSTVREMANGNLFVAFEGPKWGTDQGPAGGPVIEYATIPVVR